MKRILYILALAVAALCPSSASAQGAQRVSTALGNVNGNARVLAYARIQVCSYQPGHARDCTTAVTLYQDPALTMPYPSNPIQADWNGNYSYWVTPGNYVESVCGVGAQCLSQVITLGGTGGGGGVIPGTQLHMGRYSSDGTTIQNSNVTTDSTGNNITVPGVAMAFEVNQHFYVAGAVVGDAAACPNGGATKLECAAKAADSWGNANGSNPILHLAPGVNATVNGLSFVGTYAPNILGDGTFGSLIRQTGAISAPTVSYGCNVFASSVTLKDFQIDADFNAPSALYLGKSQEYNVEGVVLSGANGSGANSNFFQAGDSSCGGGGGASFEGHINHLTVTGRGTGPGSWAVASCSGSTPSCTVSSGGTYHWNASKSYLVGYQNGTSNQPCSAMGTITPTFAQVGTWTWGQTFYSQTLPTYTMSSVSLSGFSGCTGNFYLYTPDVPSPAYGMYLPFSTDTVFNMPVVAGAGQVAGVENQNTANNFYGLHVYNNYVGFQANGGGGHLYGYDCDSNLIMLQVVGSSSLQESGCNVFYPSSAASVYRGALLADLSQDTNHQSSFSQNNIIGSKPTDWHAFLQSTGPTDTTGTWPGSLVETSSPSINPAGNYKHDTAINATNTNIAPEVQATASANVISPSLLIGANFYGGSTSQTNNWGFQVTGSASGVPTQEIFNVNPPSNALAPVSGRFWLFNPPSTAPVNGSANVNSITIGPRGSYGDGAASHNIGWNWIVQIGAGTTPSNTFFITPTSCPGTCQISTNANIQTTGSTKMISPTHELTNGSFTGDMIPATLSANRTYTFPDASGTIALVVSNTTTTVGTSTIALNACGTEVDLTITGFTTGMTATFTPTADLSSITGWSPATTGQLYFSPWAKAANTLAYRVCNQTGSNITPSASTTWNVSVK